MFVNLTLEPNIAAVTQEGLVRRMVDYVRSQLLCTLQTAAQDRVWLRVLDLLRHCLTLQKKAVKDQADKPFANSAQTKRLRQKMEALQHQFANCGVGKLIVDVVAAAKSRLLTRAALRLGKALAAGGNAVVQESMYRYFQEAHSEGFFEQIQLCINTEIDRLKRRQTVEGGAGEEGDGKDGEEEPNEKPGEFDEEGTDGDGSDDEWVDGKDTDKAHIMPIMKLLQLMCENHNADMQKAMREQQESCGNSLNVNLVQEAVRLVECMAKKERLLNMLDKQGLHTLLGVFDFLIEVREPCTGTHLVLVLFWHAQRLDGTGMWALISSCCVRPRFCRAFCFTVLARPVPREPGHAGKVRPARVLQGDLHSELYESQGGAR